MVHGLRHLKDTFLSTLLKICLFPQQLYWSRKGQFWFRFDSLTVVSFPSHSSICFFSARVPDYSIVCGSIVCLNSFQVLQLFCSGGHLADTSWEVTQENDESVTNIAKSQLEKKTAVLRSTKLWNRRILNKIDTKVSFKWRHPWIDSDFEIYCVKSQSNPPEPHGEFF